MELAKVRAVMRQGGNTEVPFTALAVVEMPGQVVDILDYVLRGRLPRTAD